jgi:excisionase family DNA binding protein
MTPEQVAAMFSVDRRTVLKWAREGKLQSIKASKKTIRFSREAVYSFARTGYPGIESGISQNGKRECVPDLPRIKGKGGSRASRESSWRSLREEVTKWQ